jgi:hypothetical protein
MPDIPAPEGGGHTVSPPPSSVMDGLSTVARETAGKGESRPRELEGILKKEIEEKTGQPPSGTGTGGTGTPPTGGAPKPPPPTGPGSGPGTTSGPPPPGPGGVPTPPPPEKPPVAPPPSPEPVGAPKRTKIRCYKFFIINTSDKPISGLRFKNAAGVSIGATPAGWTGSTGDTGFGWRGNGPEKSIPPGQRIGPFEFCTDKPQRGVNIDFEHPDGTTSPVRPDDVRVRGRPAAEADGQIVIPATSRSYRFEATIQTPAAVGEYGITVGAKGLSGAVSTTAPNATNIGVDGNGAQHLVPNGPANSQFPTGTPVKVSFISSDPRASLSVWGATTAGGNPSAPYSHSWK